MEGPSPIIYFVTHVSLLTLLLLIWLPYGAVVVLRKRRKSQNRVADAVAYAIAFCATALACIVLYFPHTAQTYPVTGQLLADSGDGPKPVVGASLYFFTTEYANESEYLTKLEQSEWGAIVKDKTIPEYDRCSEEFSSIIRQNTGVMGPLDAKFYPIRSLWYLIKKHREFLALDPAKQQGLQEYYWKTKVTDDPEFARLAPSDLERYREIFLHGDDSDDKIQKKLDELPSVTSDSRGEFASRLPKGRHLLVARGMDSSSGMHYLWAVPFTVDGDTRFVAGDVICEARPF